MKKLWEKDWKLNKAVELFETKGDIELDQQIAEFDVYGSIAHIKMLNKIEVLSASEFGTAKKGLIEVLSLIKSGKFTLQGGEEDIHTKIENFITEKYGDVGKKIHTGRSRNDQILTDVRLYTKSCLLQLWKQTIILADSFNLFAKKYEFMPMPGYTHMQKAMPSSVGMWAGSFTEALIDDLEILKAAYNINNKSPLGSAASYGVPLALDREYTAKAMGFAALQKNSLYCQNSRGKIESEVISALNSVLFDINRFASDVMLFTTSEFGYFEVDKELCSGSSIMPQKKNVDVAELLRSKVHLGIGYYMQSLSISSNLPSGYNRDGQAIKKPLFESMELALESVKISGILLNGLHPNKKKMEEALTSEIFATHKALGMISNGKSFRDAYKEVGKSPKEYLPKDLVKVLKESMHSGGTGNLGLDNYSIQIKNEKKVLQKEEGAFNSAIKSLIN